MNLSFVKYLFLIYLKNYKCNIITWKTGMAYMKTALLHCLRNQGHIINLWLTYAYVWDFVDTEFMSSANKESIWTSRCEFKHTACLRKITTITSSIKPSSKTEINICTDAFCNKAVAFCNENPDAFCNKKAVAFCNNICHILY